MFFSSGSCYFSGAILIPVGACFLRVRVKFTLPGVDVRGDAGGAGRRGEGGSDSRFGCYAAAQQDSTTHFELLSLLK